MKVNENENNVKARVARPTYLISILLILGKICLLLIHHR